ncbi:Ionotropic GABA-aminobutyric acid receptor GRD [Operophtera brumata]|uniref:Ionotropic GABA-aminobutyric acid receptor GRD n=1 Tax=Operophtera brumata TaxID=104452 RepID=A0A0L7L8T8_OPEBR|nr:Ionotropic GABA-aminobutyric acid receptor GRD [Operophtera brumata]
MPIRLYLPLKYEIHLKSSVKTETGAQGGSVADAKGAIYLTTKNGTFPITLTSLKARDGATQPHAPKILSATAKNLSQDADQDNWGDGSNEMLFTNYVNGSYDDVDATYMWKSKRSINDAVSKNITLVLENLLKNYENSQLPTHGKGYPTVVQTNILIRSMGPVSELDMLAKYEKTFYFPQDYSMDCYFRQYWRDTRLSFLGPIRSLSLSIKMLERIWRPDTYFYNGKHSLTIKAKCPMELRSFPMDRQSCPLILGSCDFSVLQVSFNLQRHTGYFLIQVYVPCILIVVLSWATSDRVGLGITTVLTLSTISLDSRTDLPKVRYATALDWFLLMSFFYCIATLLEFAGVHYFTKELIEEVGGDAYAAHELAARRRSSARATNNFVSGPELVAVRLTMERTTQTERRVPRWRQLLYCLAGDDRYRRKRQVDAGRHGHINSVSHIDRAARVMFPASFALLNLFYWMIYAFSSADFAWSDNPINSLSH